MSIQTLPAIEVVEQRVPPAELPEPGRAPDSSAAGLQAVRPFSARTRRVANALLAVLAVITLVEAALFLTTYLSYSRFYVSTDNAKIDGDRININATTTGTLTHWDVASGTDLHPGDVIGRIDSTGKPQVGRALRAPAPGLVALKIANNGEYVRVGDTLAIGYDLSNIYVTARVEDSSVGRVHPGQPVDLTADAYPGVAMTGVVSQIQPGAAGQFTVYPSTDLDPTNIQKVKQYVPVRVLLTGTDGRRLLPGMNVTVHIRTSN